MVSIGTHARKFESGIDVNPKMLDKATKTTQDFSPHLTHTKLSSRGTNQQNKVLKLAKKNSEIT